MGNEVGKTGRTAGSAPPALQLEDIHFSYGPAAVLFGVSLTVGPGEAVALVGTNGAGKSTLLRIVAGLARPSRGRVLIAAEDVTTVPAEERANRGVVLVQGGRGVFPDLTVAENLRLQGRTVGKTRFGAARDHVLDVFPALAGRLRERAGRLSGGERQQLALAKAVMGRPRLLCVDELSLGLAPVLTEELVDRVQAINAAGTPVLLVEQSVELAASICRRAVFLEKGEVRFDGAARDLLDRTDLARAVFLGATAR